MAMLFRIAATFFLIYHTPLIIDVSLKKYNVPKYYEKYQRWARDGIRVKMTHWLCRKALSFKRIFYS